MKMFSMILTLALGFALTTMADAADNKKLLVGKWEAVKAAEGTLPVGSTVEFKADGKVSMVIGKDGKTVEGTYTIDGDSFTVSRKKEGKDTTYKVMIKKISETELETANVEGKGISFKKVK